MSKDKVEIPLEDQLHELRKYYHVILLDLLIDIAILGQRPDFVEDRLRKGYEEFGTEGWRRSQEELANDTAEELADAVIYKLFSGSDLLKKAQESKQ